MKTTTNLISEIKGGNFDERLLDIYADDTMLSYQKDRYVKAIQKFEELYGVNEVEIYSAPGRSEVGGNHTDHQRGQVLACGLNLDVIAIVTPTNDGIIKIVSDDYNIDEINVADLEKRDSEENTSESLIRGVAKRLQDEGYKIGGFKTFMTSDVLRGSGMSSSAAFEVAIGTILSGLYNDMKISPVFIAQASQYAENVYFGKPSGLMDQMASSVGSLVNIDFEDEKNPIINKVEVDFAKFGHSLCIVDTKGSHADLTPEYASVPVDMKKVASYFGKEVLREVKEEDFYANVKDIRDKFGDRPIVRAIHFYFDHNNVTDEVNALKNGDFEEFKRLITASGNSSFKFLQNVYPASDVDHQGLSVGLGVSEKILGNKGAVRVHGGGFAGTIQAFVPNDMVEQYKEAMDGLFGEGSCHVLKVRKYGGMKVC